MKAALFVIVVVKKFLLLRTTICSVINNKGAWPWPAGEEWGKMKKTGSRNVGKENGGCFSCSYDRVGRAGKLFVLLYSVKGIWLIFLG